VHVFCRKKRGIRNNKTISTTNIFFHREHESITKILVNSILQRPEHQGTRSKNDQLFGKSTKILVKSRTNFLVNIQDRYSEEWS